MAVGALQAAFEARLKAFADGEGYPVAWENTVFDPAKQAKGIPFLRPWLLMAEETMLLIDGTSGRARGIFQIDALVPLGEGRERLTIIMDALREQFFKGLEVKAQDDSARAVVLSLRQGVTVTDEPPHCKRRLDINFLAYIAG